MDTMYDYRFSVKVAYIIGAEPRRCWRNAALAVTLLPRLFAEGFYIEGWMVVPREKIIAVIEHGWSTVPGLGVVDPTVVLTEKPTQPIFYFPGYTLSRSQLSEILSGSKLPLVCHSQYGNDGMQHSSYQQAYHQALQRAQDIAKENHLPQTAIKVSRRDSRLGVTVMPQMKGIDDDDHR